MNHEPFEVTVVKDNQSNDYVYYYDNDYFYDYSDLLNSITAPLYDDDYIMSDVIADYEKEFPNNIPESCETEEEQFLYIPQEYVDSWREKELTKWEKDITFTNDDNFDDDSYDWYDM